MPIREAPAREARRMFSCVSRIVHVLCENRLGDSEGLALFDLHALRGGVVSLAHQGEAAGGNVCVPDNWDPDKVLPAKTVCLKGVKADLKDGEAAA